MVIGFLLSLFWKVVWYIIVVWCLITAGTFIAMGIGKLFGMI